MKNALSYIWERRTSFSFTVGSIIYGIYHFNNPHVLSTSNAYQTINYFFGIIGGRYFGLIFILLGSLKLYGVLTNDSKLRLTLYFALLFTWTLLCLCFFISWFSGYANAVWIYLFMVVGMSTNIIQKPLNLGRGRRNARQNNR